MTEEKTNEPAPVAPDNNSVTTETVNKPEEVTPKATETPAVPDNSGATTTQDVNPPADTVVAVTPAVVPPSVAETVVPPVSQEVKEAELTPIDEKTGTTLDKAKQYIMQFPKGVDQESANKYLDEVNKSFETHDRVVIDPSILIIDKDRIANKPVAPKSTLEKKTITVGATKEDAETILFE